MVRAPRYGYGPANPFYQAGLTPLTPGEYSNLEKGKEFWDWNGRGGRREPLIDSETGRPWKPQYQPLPDPNAPMSSLTGETIGTYDGAGTPPPDDWGDATMAAESRNERLAREAKEARLRADQEAFVRQEAFVDPEHPPPPSSYAQSPHEFDRAIMRSPETLRRLLPYGADASSIALPRPQQDASSLASVFDPGGPPDPFAEALSADRLRDTAWDTEEPALTDEMRDRHRAPRATRGPSPIPGDPYTPPSPPGGYPSPIAGRPDPQPLTGWDRVEREQLQRRIERDAAMNPPQRLQPPGRGSTAPNPFEGIDLGGMPGQEDIDRFAGGAGAIAPAPGQLQSLPLMSGPPRSPQPRPETQFAMLPNGPREWSVGIQTPGGQESRLPRARPDDAPLTPAPLSPDVPIAEQPLDQRLDPFSGPAPPLDPALAAAAERAQAPVARPVQTSPGFQPDPAFADPIVQQQAQPPPSLDPALEAAKQEARQTLQAHPDTGRIRTAPGMQQFNDPASQPPSVPGPLIRPDLTEAAAAAGGQSLTPMPPAALSSAPMPRRRPENSLQEQAIRQRDLGIPLPGDLIAGPEGEPIPQGSDVAPASPLPIAVPPVGGINQGKPLPGPQSRLYPEQEQEFTSTYDPPAINLPPLVHSDVGGAGPTYSLLGIGGDDNEPVRHAPLGPEDDPDYKFQKFGQPRSGSGIGKWLGGTAGTLLGLATGGPIGGVVGGISGWKGGKRLGGGIGDQETGWGRRFTNPNYKRDRAQEIADQKANELYRKWGIDVTTVAGARLLPHDAQGHPLDPVTGKRIDRNEDDEDKDSKTPLAKADSAKTGGVYGGGGSGLGSDRSYTGGVYGGYGGRDIGLGVGGAYRNR